MRLNQDGFQKNMLKKYNSVAVLIPAHNEAVVIASALQSFKDIIPLENVFVVDDGSEDRTSEVAEQYTPNVLTLPANLGKARAMNFAIDAYHLSATYDYILPMDADTQISLDFLEQTIPILESDPHKKIACVVGKVVGTNTRWTTIFRMWEYEVAQTIHKSAQSIENAIMVCPGCATVYRSEIFRILKLPTGTLTEDMDFTFLLHRKKLGRIVYADKAHVFTQDPLTFVDLIKQMDRWYTGFWQCVIKNNIPWGGQMVDLEVGMLAIEGLFNGLLVMALVILIPLVLYISPKLILIPLLIDLGVFLIPTLILTAIRQHIWKIFIYIPLFYLARFFSSVVFFITFIKVTVGYDVLTRWFKTNRYTVR